VLFAWGGFTGTRSFTFILSRLTAGEHRVRIQWRIDDGGTALVGDRTLTLYASPAVGKEGGLYVKATRSGPNEETRSTRFVDIPGLDSSIITTADSDLAITISGEAKMSSGARMFVRALVDDKPVSPNNVVLVIGGLKGTSSFMFTKRNLAAGSHRIRAQWRVDAGGTASIGDRTLTVSHLRGQIPDLNEPFFNVGPVSLRGRCWRSCGTPIDLMTPAQLGCK
jgi:hypothetical protein